MPHCWPGVLERIACGGYSVQPAPGRPARHEKADHQQQHGEQVNPVAEHVGIGEHHVPRPHHQRNEVIAETAQKQRGQQIDHHDHAVHGDELGVILGIDERQGAGKTQLHADQPGQHQRHRADGQRRPRILHGDDLGILGEDIFRPPAMRVVKFHLLDFGGRRGHARVMWDVGHNASSTPVLLERRLRRPFPSSKPPSLRGQDESAANVVCDASHSAYSSSVTTLTVPRI